MKRITVVIALVSLVGIVAGAAPIPASAAVVLVNGAPLYEEAGKALKPLDYLTLGDLVTQMRRTATFTEAGKVRDFVRVKAPNGKEGWIRAQYIATKASLAIVKADKAVIYTEPRDVKITGRTITGMTLVAVLQDGSTPSFARVQGYDVAQGVLFTDSTFVAVNDLATAEIDVNAGILYDVSAVTRDAVVKKNLLKVALKKYGGSQFQEKIQAALGALP